MKSYAIFYFLVVPIAAFSGFQQQSMTPSYGSSLKSSTMQDSVTESQKESVSELPPVIQEIVDERNEFRLNLGRAMDVLKKDYPEILRRSPDFSIYHQDISLVDPSGVQLSGLRNYKSAFSILQKMVNFLYSSEKSTIQIRMTYDFAFSSIRISWNLELYPKVLGLRPLYVDGISMYKLDAPSGKIIEHKIDNLIINQRPIRPPYGIFSALMQGQYSMQPSGIPAGVWNFDSNEFDFGLFTSETDGSRISPACN
mmetsp:Transcript_10729/g.15787  ORF Transcript_10729/g.15787 Transcript_10729/m.15787 type:complete len:254 (-) Transcript_10729:88-849(-)|eukprot:CAMPEP_0194247304 /NCGR_PEP_ID=MMETSP0158-20130606/16355_1 /TAXON_ID=33649 /ORGANISM="Thalassionema nitzschioides, Strain L26-B" /LENGTH=253 /DNA_ID=CAMNT_0038983373 /DNA_START=39 /DNA_END=800 /DNA_ORIENTATION=+